MQQLACKGILFRSKDSTESLLGKYKKCFGMPYGQLQENAELIPNMMFKGNGILQQMTEDEKNFHGNALLTTFRTISLDSKVNYIM